MTSNLTMTLRVKITCQEVRKGGPVVRSEGSRSDLSFARYVVESDATSFGGGI